MSNKCESCTYYLFDDENGEYVCQMDMDEDDYYRFVTDKERTCPYWCSMDKYAVVKHQN